MDVKPAQAAPAAKPPKKQAAKPLPAALSPAKKPDTATLSAEATQGRQGQSLSSLVAKCQEASDCKLVPEAFDNRFTRDSKSALAAERAATWSITVLRGVEAPTLLGSALNAWAQKGVAKVSGVLPDRVHDVVEHVKANSKTVSTLSRAGSLGPIPLVSTVLGTAFAVNDVGGAVAAHQRREAPSVLLLADAQAAASTLSAGLGWVAIGVAATGTVVAAAPFLAGAGAAGAVSFGLSYWLDHEVAQ